MRWAAIILVLIPVVLIVASSAASLLHREWAHSIRNVTRYTVWAELALLFCLVIIGAIYQRVSEARDLRLYPPPGRLVDIGGYKLHLYCTGAGSPTIVLEHGLDGSYLDWRRVQPEIARFARVCSYDRAGYGWSDRSPIPRIPSVMVEELRTALNRAGEKGPFIVVAHSMGAFDAIMYAHRFLDEVSALVLVDGSHPDEELPFRWRQKLSLRWLEFATTFGLSRWRGWCAGTDEALGGLRTAVNCKARMFRTHYEQWAQFPVAAAEVRNLENSLTLPLVIISRDPTLRADNPRERHWADLQKSLLRFSPNSTQIIAEGSGHDIPGQRPDVIVDAVRRLAEKINQTAQKPVETAHPN